MGVVTKGMFFVSPYKFSPDLSSIQFSFLRNQIAGIRTRARELFFQHLGASAPRPMTALKKKSQRKRSWAEEYPILLHFLSLLSCL